MCTCVHSPPTPDVKGQDTQVSVDGEVDMWSIHTIECFSTKKRKEILTPAIMNFEDIMLREISQSQKDKNGIHSEEVPRIVKAARARGGGCGVVV